MRPTRGMAILLPIIMFIAGCGGTQAPDAARTGGNPEEKRPESLSTTEQIEAESRKANEFFENAFTESVMRSPVMQSYLGSKQIMTSGTTIQSCEPPRIWRS